MSLTRTRSGPSLTIPAGSARGRPNLVHAMETVVEIPGRFGAKIQQANGPIAQLSATRTDPPAVVEPGEAKGNAATAPRPSRR